MNQFANMAKAANAGSNPLELAKMAKPNLANPLGSMMNTNLTGQLGSLDKLNTGSLTKIASAGASTTPFGAGAKEAGKYAWKIIKRMFRLDTLKLLVMLLLFMAYLTFILATLMFVNACINFHKTLTLTDTLTDTKKLRDSPIFDYLKTNNFMFLDTFIMNKDSKLFIATASIIGGTIGLSILHVAVLLNAEQKEKDSFTKYTAELLKHKITYIIAGVIYFIFYVPFITVYYLQIATNTSILDTNFNKYKKDNKNIISYRKETSVLLAIKKRIQHKIYGGGSSGSAFSVSDFEGYRHLGEKNKIAIDIDIASIFLIYRNNLQNKIKKAEEDRVNVEQVKRQYTRDYINYIDEYFELLGRKDADNYQKFYLVGLIEYDDNKSVPDDGGAGIYTLHSKFKVGLNSIRSKIYNYFIVIIAFYLVMCATIFALLFLSNMSIQKPVIETIYGIARKLSKPEPSAIVGIITTIILIVIIAMVNKSR